MILTLSLRMYLRIGIIFEFILRLELEYNKLKFSV